MKIFKFYFLASMIAMLIFTLQSCKSKKMTVKPGPQVETVQKEPEEEKQPEPEPVKEEPAPEPVNEEPNFDFQNILFEFDSGVLKTASYQVLDAIVREMKKDPSAKFVVNGHASIEGSPEHNMALSVDRANAVKLYLVNAGINADNLLSKGHGATQPTATNDDEQGRSLNRRVEIEVIK